MLLRGAQKEEIQMEDELWMKLRWEVEFPDSVKNLIALTDLEQNDLTARLYHTAMEFYRPIWERAGLKMTQVSMDDWKD